MFVNIFFCLSEDEKEGKVKSVYKGSCSCVRRKIKIQKKERETQQTNRPRYRNHVLVNIKCPCVDQSWKNNNDRAIPYCLNYRCILTDRAGANTRKSFHAWRVLYPQEISITIITSAFWTSDLR